MLFSYAGSTHEPSSIPIVLDTSTVISPVLAVKSIPFPGFTALRPYPFCAFLVSTFTVIPLPETKITPASPASPIPIASSPQVGSKISA